MELTLRTRPGRGCTVVQVSGVLDLQSEPDLRACLRDAVDAGARNIVLDFTDVRLMDSSGLGTVVLTYKLLAERDGRLCLATVQPIVRKVFKLTSVDRLVSIHDSVEAAEDDLAGAQGGAEDVSG